MFNSRHFHNFKSGFSVSDSPQEAAGSIPDISTVLKVDSACLIPIKEAVGSIPCIYTILKVDLACLTIPKRQRVNSRHFCKFKSTINVSDFTQEAACSIPDNSSILKVDLACLTPIKEAAGSNPGISTILNFGMVFTWKNSKGKTWKFVDSSGNNCN